MDIKQVLQIERETILRSINIKRASIKELQTAAPEAGDSAQQLEENDALNREVNQLVARIKSIDVALERIDSGDFGWCEDCGDEIPKARMETKPDALRCVDCQHELEVRSMHYRGAA